MILKMKDIEGSQMVLAMIMFRDSVLRMKTNLMRIRNQK
jgi:hypothetical protein